MNTTACNNISSPATGLQVYNTDCGELNYWNGTCWLSFGSLPAPLPIISNSATALCALSTATYSIPVVTGATGYSWAVPPGAIMNSGQGTTSISVTLGNYSGDVCVRAYDACESSELSCLEINISPIPPTPGNITGLASVNPGQANVSYFIASVPGASVYNWSVPSGATIITGVGTPAITVNFACNAVSGNVSVTAGSNCGTSSPSSQAITLTPLIVNAGSAQFGGTSIGGSPTVSGGQTPYIYSWGPNSNLSGSAVANPTALCSGSTTTYSISVSDANGCTATSSVIVTRNLAANAGSAVFGGVPIGGSPTATGGQIPYTYSWSPNNNLSSYANANPTAQCNGSTTSYTITVNDANGCTATSSVAVTRTLAASAGSNNTICVGNSTSIGGSPAATGGNSSSYIYSWNPAANLTSSSTANPTANPTSNTTYSVTVTDANGCTATNSMTLTVNSIPGAAGAISGTNSVCQSSNGIAFSVSAIANAGGYVWTYTGSGFSIATGNNTNSITANFSSSATAGNLTVYGTNPGCSNGATSATYSITINSTTHGSQTFSYTGSQQTFTVPSCVSSITIKAYGAQGGQGDPSGAVLGGLGGYAFGTVNVTNGATLYVYVGGTGGASSSNTAGVAGYNGGGAGGGGNDAGGGGGGASDVRSGGAALSNRIIVGAGGGGGSGANCGSGGIGGYPNGGICPGTCYVWGLAGTQTAGGAAGSGGSAGTLGTGGAAGAGCAGGGGGGYYGGGGGGSGCCGGAGGGGSSYYGGMSSNTGNTDGIQSGNGQVVIIW